MRSFHTSEPHGLIADHTGATVNRVGVKSSQGGIGYGTKHEETAKLMQSEKAGEVKVGAIHDVEGTAFRQQHIYDINIMQFAIGDMDECWDISLQIQQSMEFYRGFGFAIGSISVQIETAVDGSTQAEEGCCGGDGE